MSQIPGVCLGAPTDDPANYMLEDEDGQEFTICTTYEVLVRLLGEPSYTGGEKITSQWNLRHDGGAFRLLDYKATSAYAPDLPALDEFRQQPYAWLVQTDGSEAAARGAALVRSAVMRTS
ncbi:MAG TPA: hypothetical protein VGM88_03255 [Kofleriaceae bacterium]